MTKNKKTGPKDSRNLNHNNKSYSTRYNRTVGECVHISRVELEQAVKEHVLLAQQKLTTYGSHADLVVLITDTAPTALVTGFEEDSDIAAIAKDCNARAVINIRAQTFSSVDCPEVIGILSVQAETPSYRYAILCPFGLHSFGQPGFYESIILDDLEYRYFKGAS